MTTPATCPECGTVLPAASPRGLCPACLLKRGLETNTIPSTAPAPSWTPPAPAELAARFPELEILRLVGRGGMGAVYQARQKNLDRQVALKILPPEIGRDPSFTERFSREAQAMARLNHPHIVTIHEFGERQGLFYFLMEFVDGVSLRTLLSAGHVTSKEALAIVPQICEALQYAHEQGIVHRDIKPENILINKQGQVKIADFGLAKLMGVVGEAERIMGTPQYMAPEQIERPADVDHRADIYSLGVVFYQMLTGELPTGRFAVPSQKVQIDVRLDEVVLKALEREPEKRYQQVSQVQTEVTMITQTPWREAYAQAKSTPHAEGEAAGGARQPPVAPRFSRTAILGAAWAMLFFVAVPPFLAHEVETHEFWRNGPIRDPLMAVIFFLILLPAFVAPFGVSLCGYIALLQIRHSSGRICGLGLAFFDALLFPLLAIDAFLIWASSGLALTFAHVVGRPFFPPEPWGHVYPAPFLWTVLATTLCLISNIWIIRAAWRAAKSPIPGERIAKGAPPRRISPALTTLGAISIVALAIAIGIAGDYFLEHPRPTAAVPPLLSTTSTPESWPEAELSAFQSALGHNDPPDTLVFAGDAIAHPSALKSDRRPNDMTTTFGKLPFWGTIEPDWAQLLGADAARFRANIFLGSLWADSTQRLVAVDVIATDSNTLEFSVSSLSADPRVQFHATVLRKFIPESIKAPLRIYAGQATGGGQRIADFCVRIVQGDVDERLDGRLMPDGSIRLTPRRGYMPISDWEVLKAPNTPVTRWDSALRDIYGGGPQTGDNGWVLSEPIERSITSDNGINLVSGEIVPLERPIGQGWLQEHNVDAMIDTGDLVRAGDMQAVAEYGNAWNPFAPQVALTIDSRQTVGPPQFTSAGNPTWYFRTRKGLMGVLQVVSQTENPPAVKIRYKRVERTGALTQGVFLSLKELLAGLPPDARPDPAKGWDEFSSAKATQWFEDHINGKGFCVTLDSVVEDVNINARTGRALEWEANFSLDVHPPHAPGVTLSLQNGGGFGALLGPNSFLTVAGDEPFARAAKALAPGAHVSVSGVIDQCRVYPSLGLSMDLIAPAVTWPKVAATAPAPPVSPEVALIGRWESTKIENDPDVKHVVLTFSSDHKVATSTETAGAPPFEDTEPWGIVDASHLRVGAKDKDGKEVSEVATFELSGDTLVIQSDDHITLTLRRATASPPATAP